MYTIYNFFFDHDLYDIDHYLTENKEEDADFNPGQMRNNDFEALAATIVTAEEKSRAEQSRDWILWGM